MFSVGSGSRRRWGVVVVEWCLEIAARGGSYGRRFEFDVIRRSRLLPAMAWGGAWGFY
jgi:hypothetical protein